MKENNKVCIIGIDGGTFTLIKPWAEKGYLPNLHSIITNGSHSILDSSIPDNSAPAWTSIITGKNPGKHMVFGFTSPGSDIANIRISNSQTRASASIWDIFSRNNKKVCVINVPLTYPPEEVNGIMISGMDTPGIDTVYTYPESLKDELNKEFGRYRIEPETATAWTSLSEKKKLAYIDEIHDIARLRCQVVASFLRKYPWDLFMVVFVAVDRIQHKFWGDMDRSYPFFLSNTPDKLQNAILNTYRLIDSFVGKISSLLSDDTTLVIVSDHGFGPRSPDVVSVNRFLNRHHLLKYKREAQGGFAGGVHSMNSIIFDFAKRKLSPRRQQILKKVFPFLRGKAVSYLNFAGIDWSKTKVFADEPMGLIWVNRKGRFNMGIVTPGNEYEDVRCQTIALLRGLKDPKTGRAIIRSVYKKEDVYTGQFLNEAPDIVFSYNDEFSFPENTSLSRLFKGDDFIGRANDVGELLQITGIHRPDGIIIFKGRNIRKGARLEGARVIDVMPTSLYLSGMPIPEDVDGRVLNEIIEEGFIKRNPVHYEDIRRDKKDSAVVYSEEEEKRIEARLKDLGYL